MISTIKTMALLVVLASSLVAQSWELLFQCNGISNFQVHPEDSTTIVFSASGYQGSNAIIHVSGDSIVHQQFTDLGIRNLSISPSNPNQYLVSSDSMLYLSGGRGSRVRIYLNNVRAIFS